MHPGLWTDERFVSVSMAARLFFIGLWNEADDQGSFEWSPLKLKMRILAADNADAAALLDELKQSGHVMHYTAEGKWYGAIRNFQKFQRPKKPNSLYPQPVSVRKFVAAVSVNSTTGTELGTEESGIGSPPVPHQFPTSAEKSPQMEEEGGRREDVAAVTVAARDPATDLIAIFDEILAEVWGDARKRPWPAGKDLATARGWLATGADIPAIRWTLKSRMEAMASKGKAPPGTLSYFDAAITDLCADITSGKPIARIEPVQAAPPAIVLPSGVTWNGCGPHPRFGQWFGRVRSYREGGFWLRNSWGPEPDAEWCEVNDLALIDADIVAIRASESMQERAA